MSFLGVSLGLGAVTAGTKIFTGLHQNHLANQISPQWQQYQTSPFAKQQLGIAQQLFGGRMAGAADEERNIAASQAQYQNNINQNATDSSQALALGGLSQGQANQAYNQLGIQEQQNKYNLLNNLNAGYQAMVGEGNKVYQSMLDKYQSDVAAKQALRGAGAQNVSGGFNDLASTAFLGYSALNNPNSTAKTTTTPVSQPFTPFNMNAATGGLAGNWNVLQGGNPFAVNPQDFKNPYGE